MLTSGKSHNPPESRILQVIVCAVLIAAAFCVSCDCSTCWLFPTRPMRDSSVFRYIGLLMKNGGIPYRDTFDHKGPILYFINYLGILFGVNGVWLFELLFLSATSILTYKVIRRFCSSCVSAAGAVIVMFQLHGVLAGGNRVQEYALPFIVCSLLIFVKYLQMEEVSKLELAICGACFMVVLLLRVDFVTLWVAMCPVVLIRELRKKNNRLGYFLRWFLLGAAFVLIPVLLYLCFNGAIHEFWRQYIQFNVRYTGAEPDSHTVDQVSAIFLSGSFLIPAAILCVSALIDKKNRVISLSTLCYTVLTAAVTALPGRSFSYYCIILLPAMVVPAALLIAIVEKIIQSRTLLWICILLAVAVAVFPWTPILTEGPDAAPFYRTSEYAISNWIRENTEATDTIITCGNYDLLYVLSDRKAASRYSYQMPIAMVDPDIYGEFIEDLEKNQPAVLVWSSNDLQGKFDLRTLKKCVGKFVQDNHYTFVNTCGQYTVYAAARISHTVSDLKGG